MVYVCLERAPDVTRVTLGIPFQPGALHLTLWSAVTAQVPAGESSRKYDQGPGIHGYRSITDSFTRTPNPGSRGTVSSPRSIGSGSRSISDASGNLCLIFR